MRGWIGPALLLCAAMPAQAQNWVQVGDSPIEGMESCVDPDSITPGPDGKTEFHQKFCGIDKIDTYRVDCRQDVSATLNYEAMKNGAFRAMTARPSTPMGDSIRWVCARRK